MDRRAFLAVVSSTFIGCSRSVTISDVAIGQWDKAQVEQWFKDQGWQAIHLTEDAHWKYSGTGTDKDGTEWTKVTVTQSENGLDWTNSNEKGSGGNGSFRGGGSKSFSIGIQ